MSMQTNPTTPSSNARKSAVGGAALIAIGALALGAQLTDIDQLGVLIPLALGLIFLAWGLVNRSFGLLIPGGILSGIGVGAILIELTPFANGETAEGGLFLLAFAAGWVLISALSVFTEQRFQWWPLIPGGILATVGALLLNGDAGLRLLEIAGLIWPLGLLAAGIYLLLHRRKA
ncbi:MAG: hypothetical protein GY759_02320 [Chloroflexi bacterium]|nr:hypothetical protein [Chloroflexota bacterium]